MLSWVWRFKGKSRSVCHVKESGPYTKHILPNLNTEIFINEQQEDTHYSNTKSQGPVPWTLFARCLVKNAAKVSLEQHLRVRDTGASRMSDFDTSKRTRSIFVPEAAWSPNLLRSDWMALWLLYSCVHLKSLSCQGFLTTLITQQSSHYIKQDNVALL